jgi:FixJ family two-component response regulator
VAVWVSLIQPWVDGLAALGLQGAGSLIYLYEENYARDSAHRSLRRGAHPMTSRRVVAVIDDDESVRESLPDLLRELGYDAEAFSSAEDFLESGAISRAGCLILDVAMPGMSGPDLLRHLRVQGFSVPIIFITAHGDDLIRPQLIEQGAIACLFKPFDELDLRTSLDAAFTSS